MPPYPVFPFDPEDTEPLMEKAKRFDMINGRQVTDEERLQALPFIRRNLQSKTRKNLPPNLLCFNFCYIGINLYCLRQRNKNWVRKCPTKTVKRPKHTAHLKHWTQVAPNSSWDEKWYLFETKLSQPHFFVPLIWSWRIQLDVRVFLLRTDDHH